MIPRASALETRSLLKPLSCQAIASASAPGTPFAAATEAICEALSRSGVGYGGFVGSPCAGVPTGWLSAVAPPTVVDTGSAVEPDGTWIGRPASRTPLRSRPFAAAIAAAVVPARAAIAVRVSPGTTR